jgi:serine/threonine protein kinase/FixJ family two-component response regulator
MSPAAAALMIHDSDQKKILIAEDFTETAASMKRLLEYEGYKVYIAVDGRMAVEKALPIMPDLIILDAIMPVMNGLEACRILKENTVTRNIPVIFISADDRQETRDTALSLGALRYFIKPIDSEEVFEFIAQTLGAIRSTVLIEEETQPEVTDTVRSTKNKAKDPFRICGTVLDSKYELIEFAGAGGMGAVYRAVNRINGETVAVKILQPHIVARSPEYAELFEREAKHAQGLDHEHIVKIYDSGKDDDLSYMVMEWVEGRSLEDVLTQGQIPLDRLTCTFEQICGAVAFAHERNVIHLDLKPGNILLIDGPDAENFVKVIDFGLSRVISQESGTTVTKFRGTHQFCAPEQFGGKVSHRSDIYSLGATLYYLLTGVIPFGASYINAKIHPNLELPEIPSITRQRSVPTGVDSVIKKALNKNPNLRQQSVLELYEEFRAALELHAQDSENKLPDTASSGRKRQGMADEGKGPYVRRDEKGRFYESDDIGRSLRLDSERQKKKEGSREANLI